MADDSKTKYILLEAEIVDAHEVLPKGAKKSHTEYELRVTRGKFKWRVRHRFSEFDDLRKRLQKAHPGIVTWPAFPGKTLFGKMGASVIEARKTALSIWISEVLKISQVSKDQQMLLFLEADTEGVPPLISMLMMGDIQEKRFAVDQLYTLSSNPEKRDKIVRCGGVKLILSFAVKESIQIQKVCLRAVYNLIAPLGPCELTKDLVHAGGIKVLLALQKSEDPEVAREAILTMAELCRTNGEKQAKVIRELTFAPFLEHLAQCRQENSNSKTVIALNTIRYLIEDCERNRVYLLDHSILDMFVEMSTGEVAFEVLIAVAHLLSFLALDPFGKQELLERRVLRQVATMVTINFPDLHSYAAQFYARYLYELDPSLLPEVLKEIMPTLTKLLDTRHTRTFKHTLNAFVNMTVFNEAAAKSVVGEGVLEKVHAGLGRFNGDLSCERFAAAFIANVTEEPSCRVEVFSRGLIPAVKNLVCSKDDTTRVLSVKALAHIMSDNAARDLWMDEAWVRIKLSSLETFSVDMQIYAALTIMYIGDWDDTHVHMCWERTMKTLASLSSSHEHSDLVRAITIITHIYSAREKDSTLSIFTKLGGTILTHLATLLQCPYSDVHIPSLKILLWIANQVPSSLTAMDQAGITRSLFFILRSERATAQTLTLHFLNLLFQKETIRVRFIEEGQVMLRKVDDGFKVSEEGRLGPLLYLLDAYNPLIRTQVKGILSLFQIDTDNPTSTESLFHGRYRLGVIQRRLTTNTTRVAQDIEQNMRVGLKFIPDTKKYKGELAILEAVGQDIAPQVIECIEGDENAEDELVRMNCIVHEAVESSLAGHLRRVNLTNKGKKNLSVRIAQMLKQMHEAEVVHSMLTVDNIVKCLDAWKLAGLEHARPVGQMLPLKFSMRTCSPEMATAVRSSTKMPAATPHDIWALGVLIYELYAGQPLFEDNSDLLQLLTMDEAELDIPMEHIYDRDIQKLLPLILRKNPDDRLEIEEILESLERAEEKAETKLETAPAV